MHSIYYNSVIIPVLLHYSLSASVGSLIRTTGQIVTSLPYLAAVTSLATPDMIPISRVTEDERGWIIEQAKLCNITIPKKLVIYKARTEEGIARGFTGLIVSPKLLVHEDRDKNGPLVRAMLLHAFGHASKQEQAAYVCGIPLLAQAGSFVAYKLGTSLMSRLTKKDVSFSIAYHFLQAGTSIASLLTILLYLRYQEICADKTITYHADEAYAYATYLKEKQNHVENNRFYRWDKVWYELLSSTPLYAKRALWLEKGAQKIQQLKESGVDVMPKKLPSFVPAIVKLLAGKIKKAFA